MPEFRHVITLAELRTFYSVYLGNDDWDGMLELFRNDPTDWYTVQALTAELQESRFFREPIRVGLDEDDLAGPRWVWDGTHRVCAYILAGVDEVEVIFAEEATEDLPEPVVSIETVIKRRDGGNFSGEDYAEKLWQTIMSLRLDERTWLVSDLYYGHPEGDSLHVVWSDDAIGIPVAHIDEAIWVKLARFGYDVTELEIATGVFFVD